jgi:SAM-dependent methyltransferase
MQLNTRQPWHFWRGEAILNLDQVGVEMAHVEQMFFFQNVRHFFPRYFEGTRVLEIGALNINGTVRVFFDKAQYTGIDIGVGDCVDEVCRGEDYPAAACTFDVVLSTEVFEHAENWDLIFLNMLRLAKPDGLVAFSCASRGRTQHGTSLFSGHAAPHVAQSTDYYRNLMAKDFTDAFKMEFWFSDFFFVEDMDCLYFVGLVRKETNYLQSMQLFKQAYGDYLHKRHVLGLPHKYITTGAL